MKKIFLISLIIIQSCVVFAQNRCINDSAVREIQFHLIERDTETVFYYFNNEWIAEARPDMVETDSISKMEVKDDEYGNRAVFITVSPERLARLKSEVREMRFKEPGTIFIRGGENSFISKFSSIEAKIKQLYENLVFETAKDPDFNIADICTAGFIQRLEKANDFDSEGYATWLLRSGMQDGDDSPSKIISITAGANNTVIVNWSDMGHIGSTTFSMIKSDGEWKINDATVPEGYKPL